MPIKSRHILLTVLLIVCVACARQGYPEGGNKDVVPPKVVEEKPNNGTLNFNEKTFFVGFDEYVVINDADNNVIVSPPIKPKPTYTTKKHGIQVTLGDSLQENTTYLFQFKGAIADLNEGNKLQSYEYAFSTGDVIDSMKLQGKVVDAFSLTPRKNAVTLMLYPAESDDSAVAKESPLHITRSDEQGLFQFSRIKPGHFRIVAIEDGDKDLRYGSNEAIAFLDSAVTALVPSDSQSAPILMLMSYEERQTQRVTESKFIEEGYAEITTAKPMMAPIIECDTPIVWRITDRRDTIRLWTRNPKGKSLSLILADSSGIKDTLKMQWRAKRKGSTPKKGGNKWCNWGFGTTTAYFQPLRINFKTPVDSMLDKTDSIVWVLRLSDSVCFERSLTIDSSLLFATIDFEPKVDEKYTFTLPKNRIRNIFGTGNDSMSVTTTIQGDDKYGNIIVDIADANDGLTYVVQVTDESGKVKQTHSTIESHKVSFLRLTPGNYKVQAFADRDNNGEWTPGDYWQHRQPEEVYYLGKTLNLRANWDIEETLSVKAIMLPAEKNEADGNNPLPKKKR